MKKEEKVFRSRISVLLSLIMFAPLILLLVVMLVNKIYLGVFILGMTLLPVVLLFTGMRYVISGDILKIKIWSIPSGSTDIANILSVERSYNVLSSPSASLKRLRVSLKKEAKFPYMLISPDREQEFIEALKAVNPDIYVRIPDKKGVWRIWDWDF